MIPWENSVEPFLNISKKILKVKFIYFFCVKIDFLHKVFWLLYVYFMWEQIPIEVLALWILQGWNLKLEIAKKVKRTHKTMRTNTEKILIVIFHQIIWLLCLGNEQLRSIEIRRLFRLVVYYWCTYGFCIRIIWFLNSYVVSTEIDIFEKYLLRLLAFRSVKSYRVK